MSADAVVVVVGGGSVVGGDVVGGAVVGGAVVGGDVVGGDVGGDFVGGDVVGGGVGCVCVGLPVGGGTADMVDPGDRVRDVTATSVSLRRGRTIGPMSVSGPAMAMIRGWVAVASVGGSAPASPSGTVVDVVVGTASGPVTTRAPPTSGPSPPTPPKPRTNPPSITAPTPALATAARRRTSVRWVRTLGTPPTNCASGPPIAESSARPTGATGSTGPLPSEPSSRISTMRSTPFVLGRSPGGEACRGWAHDSGWRSGE
jgi:hypothetical protein